MKNFKDIGCETTEIYKFSDDSRKQVWTVKFVNNEFIGTEFNPKQSYTRQDWVRLAEFAGIIEDLCKKKETPYNPDRVMNTECSPEEEEQWKIIESQQRSVGMR